MISRHIRQSGAVSLFLVILTALLVTVVAAGFVKLMVVGQQQATNSDLSQSAYDSAMAGVEDAKRAIVARQKCINNNDTSPQCDRLKTLNETCQTLQSAGVQAFSNGEVTVGDDAQNQAYTCVMVKLNTDSYTGNIKGDARTVLVPLRGTQDFSSITIRWFNNRDIAEGQAPTLAAGGVALPPKDQWAATTPPIMRTQLLHFGKNNINLDAFNHKAGGAARTLFLYPSAAGLSTVNFEADGRNGTENSPKNVGCQGSITAGEYLCSVTLQLPSSVQPASEEAYLQLEAIYGSGTTHFEIVLNGAQFDGVQPQVDSTGRAGDLFRRVRANVTVNPNGVSYQYPQAALSINGIVCKNFFVTNDTSEYGPGACLP